MPTRAHVLQLIARELSRLEVDETDPFERTHRALDVAERCTRAIHDYARSRQDRIEPLQDAVQAALRSIAAGPKELIPTGLSPLDEAIGGLRRGELAAVGGQPGMGRTSLALTVADCVAQRGMGVILAALELDPEHVARRLIAMRGRLRWDQLAPAMLDPTIEEAANDLASLPLHVIGSGNVTPSSLAAHVRARGLDPMAPAVQLLVVDRVQLLRTRSDRNPGEDAKALWTALRELARELDIAVLVTTELRSSPSAWPRPPTIADLPRGCQRDADVVLLLDRREVVKRIRGLTVTPHLRHRCDVTIVRRRHGEVGQVTLHFDEATGTFLGAR